MSHSQSLARNATWLITATTAQKAISFLTFTLVARLVGAEITGLFFFAVSITSIFVTFTDLGITPVLIREMSASEERGRELLRKAIRIKWALIPLAIAGVLIYAFSKGLTGEVLIAVLLAIFVMSSDAVSLLWYGAIRGRRLLQFEAVGMFTGQVFTATVSILAALSGWGVIGLVGGLLAGSIWNVFWSAFQAKRLGLIGIKGKNWPLKTIVKYAMPFALAGIFVKIYSYIDTLLLEQFHGAVMVGHYAVAYKVTYALQFVPLAFVAALYPSMSAASAKKEAAELRRLLKGSWRLMLMAAVPMTALLSSLAAPFIELVYGQDYLGSILPMMILPWVLIPIFLDFPIGSLLNASHRAGKKTASMGVAMVVNVIANILLIPELGAVGASISGVISFWALFLVGMWFIRKDMKGIWKWFISLFLRGMLASAIIWFLMRSLVSLFPFMLLVLIGIVVGTLVLLIFGLVTISDLKTFLNYMRRRATPIQDPTHSPDI